MLSASFYKQRSWKSEVFEVCHISRIEPGRCSGGPVEKEKEKERPRSIECYLKISWVMPGETVPLLGVHLEEAALPLRRQKSY